MKFPKVNLVLFCVMNVPKKPKAAMPSSFTMEVKQISPFRLPRLQRSQGDTSDGKQQFYYKIKIVKLKTFSCTKSDLPHETAYKTEKNDIFTLFCDTSGNKYRLMNNEKNGFYPYTVPIFAF